MNIDELIDIIDSNLPESQHYLNLFNAINDWPDEINEVSEYYEAVKEYLNIESENVEEIKKAFRLVKHKDSDFWKLESLCELIIFLNCEKKNLRNEKRKFISKVIVS
ncbi:hypothetical protein ACOSP6_08840 [Tenacibaculum sp. MEBiC06402]|uniref:hypothetical protein n=1 Tax=unclassified Tenacibaculum TaxID=2635139 RepID=UPI003B9C0002